MWCCFFFVLFCFCFSGTRSEFIRLPLRFKVRRDWGTKLYNRDAAAVGGLWEWWVNLWGQVTMALGDARSLKCMLQKDSELPVMWDSNGKATERERYPGPLEVLSWHYVPRFWCVTTGLSFSCATLLSCLGLIHPLYPTIPSLWNSRSVPFHWGAWSMLWLYSKAQLARSLSLRRPQIWT